MSDLPDDLFFTQSHEWLKSEDDGTVTIGITHYAQSQLGDLVFVELPDAARCVTPGEEVAVVESVKTASDVYAPVSGEVIAINEALRDSPELVNQDPYGQGWLFRLRIMQQDELSTLLSAEQYQQHLE